MDDATRRERITVLLAKAASSEFPGEVEALLDKAEELMATFTQEQVSLPSETTPVVKDSSTVEQWAEHMEMVNEWLRSKGPQFAQRLRTPPGYCEGGVWQCACKSKEPHLWATRVAPA